MLKYKAYICYDFILSLKVLLKKIRIRTFNKNRRIFKNLYKRQWYLKKHLNITVKIFLEYFSLPKKKPLKYFFGFRISNFNVF